MGEDILNKFISEWRQLQLQRTKRRNKIGYNNVRIYCQNKQYYATVAISRTFIMINPNDPQIPVQTITESRLEGFIEDGRKGLKLNCRFNNPPIKLVFQTIEQREKAIIKLKAMIGDRTTSESSSSAGSPSAESSNS